MHKLKHGDRVTCEIDGTKIDDARISVDRDGDYFICHNKKSCNGSRRPDNMFDYKYFWMFTPECPEISGVTNLTVIPRTLDDLMVGDEILDSGQNKLRVLARIENLVAISRINIPYASTLWHDIETLKGLGYTTVQSIEEHIEEPIEELTMEEVCKRLGKQVKIKK